MRKLIKWLYLPIWLWATALLGIVAVPLAVVLYLSTLLLAWLWRKPDDK